MLLKLGVDPNGHGPGRDAPLRLAAMAGYVNVVRLLLDHGADPNPRDAHAGTSVVRYGGFELALAARVFAINGLLVARGAKTDPQHDGLMKELEAAIPRPRGKKK